jgi:hypothetical protein
MNTNEKGELAFLKVQMRAIEKGMILSKPIREGTRYDVILDDGKTLKKVQIKYGDGKVGYTDTSVSIKLASNTRGDKWQEKPYTKDEIDMVLAYLPSVDYVCAFGPDVFDGKPRLYVQVKQAKYNRQKCLKACDYKW